MPLKWFILGPLIAVGGGIFGIFAASYQESGFGWYILPFVAAPIFEEAIKPCGVYWLLAKKPQALPNQKYIAFLAALAGLSFALIENLLYLEVFFPEHNHAMVVWRYSVCILVHVSCSYTVGFGINQKLIAWVRGEVPFLQGNRRFFFIPMAVHSLYNISAFLIETRFEWFTDAISGRTLFSLIG
ncbi:MAG: PrsW family glutamic-type intramembrane protease [Chloroflexota bacterium]|nr:PrsW family glutamic-type intramembrane protease [Chloroflexota bacterium]